MLCLLSYPLNLILLHKNDVATRLVSDARFQNQLGDPLISLAPNPGELSAMNMHDYL